MTSTNLHSNKLGKMLKILFKRNYLALILSAVFSAAVSLLAIQYILAEYSVAALEKAGTVFDAASTAYIPQMLAYMAIVIACCILFFLQIGLFKETYSKRASDWLFSLPVKRQTYYNAAVLFNIFTVAVYYIVMVIVFAAEFLSPASAWSNYFVFDLPGAFAQMLFSFLAAVGSALVLSFAAALSGKVWHYILLTLFVFNTFAGVGEAVCKILSRNWGYYTDSLIGDISVPSVSMMLMRDEGLVSSPVLWVLLGVQIVLAYVLGLVAFKKRRAEIAEMSVGGRAVVFTVAFVTALDAFLIVYQMPDNSDWGILLGIVAAFLAAIICICILTLTKKRYIKLSLAGAGAAAAAALVFVIAANYLPHNSYRNYVPAAEEVESVRVMEDHYGYYSYGVESVLYSLMEALDGGTSSDNFYFDQTLTSDEAKACTEALHKMLVADVTEETTKELEELMSADSYSSSVYDSLHWVVLEYKLKDGSTVKRSYYADARRFYNELVALMQTEECVKNILPSTIDPDRILFLALNSYDVEAVYGDELGEDYATTELVTLDDYTPFLEVYAGVQQEESVLNFIYAETDLCVSEQINAYNEEAYSNTYYIEFYCIDKNATDEEIQQLRSMTPAEIYKMYNSGYDGLVTYSWVNYGYPVKESMLILPHSDDDRVLAYLLENAAWESVYYESVYY